MQKKKMQESIFDIQYVAPKLTLTQNFYAINMKLGQNEVGTHEYHILTKFHNDCVEIVDFH